AMAKNRLEGYLGLGECLLRLDDFNGALEQLEKARDLDPDYGPVQYSLGMALRALGRREEAEVALAKGMQWEFSSTRYLPDELSEELSRYTVNFVGRIENAVELIESGRAQEAVGILGALHRSRPQDTTVMVNLAAAHIKLAQLEQARVMLDKALTLKPSEFAIWLNLASCYNDMGRLPEAETHVNRAIELAPKVGRAHFIRALILVKGARLEETYDALKTCVRLDPRKADVYDFLAEICIRLGLTDEALAHFQTSVGIEPDNLASQVSLGIICVRTNRKREAQAALAAAQRLNPDYGAGLDVADQKTQTLAARIAAMP
ncbi:MAG: tetratricopeptide repeat protein, partial [Planctomycetota bacterium]|nr:tetratricopeptide repeat protein [Planctomycetota bacterium]